MRILKVRVQNINSLKGNWSINFEDPAYAAGGLFAICGPTGAGKSSLLDAICIALYGSTPRLGELTGNANEAMTRGTGIMESEVTFLAKGVRYRALYSQRRARSRADGRLQGSNIELSRWNDKRGDWDILEAKYKKRFAELIEEITGLTFHQFTRSALLAQGNFSVFLKAKEDERSNALEAITGTEIYSRISQAVYERYKSENTALEHLKSEAGGVGVMADTERQQTLSALCEIKAKCAALEDTVKAKEAVRDLVRERDATSETLQTSQKELTSVKATIEELRRERHATEVARRALKIKPTHTALYEAQLRVQSARQQCEKLTGALAAADKEAGNAQSLLQEARIASVDLAKAYEALLPVTQAVRAHDTAIAEHTKRISEKVAEKTREEALLKQSLAKTQAATSEIQTLSEEAVKLEADTAPDSRAARLFAKQAEIFTALTQFADADTNRSKREKAQQQAEAELAVAVQATQDAQLALAPAQTKIHSLQEKLSAVEIARTKCAAGKTLQEWTQLKTQTDARTAALNQLLQQLAKKAEKSRQIDNKKELLGKLQADWTVAKERYETQVKLTDSLADTVEALEQTAAMRSLVERLSDERAKLVDGSPCPLCGAVHHPYAESRPSILSDDSQKLDRTKKDWKDAQKSVTVFAKELAKLDGSIKAEQQALEELKKVFLQELQAIESLAGQWSVSVTTPADIRAVYEETREKAGALTEKIKKLASLDDERNNLISSLDLAKAQFETQSLAVKTCEAKRTQAQATLQSAQNENVQATAQLLAARDGLARVCAGLIKVPATAAQAKAWSTKLQTEVDTFQTKRTRLATIGQQIAVLKTTMQEQRRQQDAFDAKCTELATVITSLENERSLKQTERTALFGDKSPEAEEAALKNRRDAALALTEKRTAEALRLKGLVNVTQGQLDAAEKQAASDAESLQAALSVWTQERTAAGFAEDSLWEAALLTAEEIDARQQTYARLDARCEELAKTARQAQEKLKQLASKIEPTIELASLVGEIESLRESMNTLTAEKGRLQGLIETDDAQKQRLAEKLDAIKAQEKTLALWSRLNALIGSADGKRYRTFVQSMTFETLLHHANRALSKISQRYILKKDAVEPLKLNVIDAFQGGVERSADNLSGGESFLVSLSLALGLSEMASRNVRVESLFLDEGFGSLDPDTLEDAMNALAALQSEGKMIGIISHVGEVRERITTLIDVTPVSGGRSELSGPGVERLEEQKK